MRYRNTVIGVATATALIFGAGIAYGEMNDDTRAGQFCGQNEHGRTFNNGNILTCVKDGNHWRWKENVPSVPQPDPTVVVTVPGLTG